MHYVILDLEWNGAYSKRHKKYINEIIEVGAIRVNEKLEIVDTFTELIRPQIGKKISGRVKELTNISNEELSSSKNTFTHVMRLFKRFSKDSIILTWGITDISTLIENNKYYNKKSKLDFLEYYMNLQSYCENFLKKSDPGKQMGLSTAAELLEINFGEESLHRALQDSELSLLCFKKTYDAALVQKFVKKADAQFYNRISFKNIMLTDITNPLLDKEQLFVCCSKCGNVAKQIIPWEIKNKAFRSSFHCDNCNYDFNGKVQYKLKFEGVQIKKATFPRRESLEESP